MTRFQRPVARPRDVRPINIRSILEAMVEDGREGSVGHVRGTLKRYFDSAVVDGLAEVNPVPSVHLPRSHRVRKPRIILTDVEFETFVVPPRISRSACWRLRRDARAACGPATCRSGTWPTSTRSTLVSASSRGARLLRRNVTGRDD